MDVLLISPERLNNPDFRDEVLPKLASEVGLLVVDEAHTVSDWSDEGLGLVQDERFGAVVEDEAQHGCASLAGGPGGDWLPCGFVRSVAPKSQKVHGHRVVGEECRQADADGLVSFSEPIPPLRAAADRGLDVPVCVRCQG